MAVRGPSLSRRARTGRAVLGGALVLMAWVGTAFARDDALPRIKTWPIAQAYILNSAYGRLDSCGALQAAYVTAGWPRGISLATMQQLDRRLKSGVILRPDPGPDTWTPLARTVVEGKSRPGADCDDVAITSAQLAVCAGFPARSLGLMITQLPSGANDLHLVAYFIDTSRSIWVFGDTMGRPRPLAQLGQRIHYHAQFSDLTKWWVVRDPENGALLTQGLPTSTVPDEVLAFDADRKSCAPPQP